MHFSERIEPVFLHQDPQVGKIPVLSEVYRDIAYKCLFFFNQKCHLEESGN